MVGLPFLAGTSCDGTFDDCEWFLNLPAHAPHQERPGILGAETIDYFTCGADGIAYEVRAVQLPKARQKDGPERILEAARSIVAKARGAQPRNVRETLLAARPAEEYDLEPPSLKPKQLRVKAVVIGRWLFELSVTASKADVNGRAADEFFDSFAFQPSTTPSADRGNP